MLQREKHFRSREKVFGQFFTDPKVADFIVSFASISLERKNSGCDPACGDGVFLSSLIKQGFESVVGIDIDKKCVEDIPINVREKSNLFVGDSLNHVEGLPASYFDLVVGNPPFSAKYGRITDSIILSSFELGSGLKSQAVEILFLELFIQLARDGGIIGIILPDGVFQNINNRKVRNFILNNCRVLAVVSLPRAIFNSSKSTTSKTSILFAQKGQKHKGKVFMAEMQSLNEIDKILNLYIKKEGGSFHEVSEKSLHPKTYIHSKNINFGSADKLKDFIFQMYCGSTKYGKERIFAQQGIRYISAKVVTNLGIDFTKDNRGFIEPNTLMDNKKAHVNIGDVLFIRIGVGCIGRAAVVIDERDLGIVDDYIYVIRVKKDGISPYYLAIFLQSKYGKFQIDIAKRGVGTVTIPQSSLKEIYVPTISNHSILEKEYIEMVSLRKNKRYREAKEIYNKMISDVENELSKIYSF